ncbi:MAG: 16S rRNA (adenine(1518)-N(6)/adenine(1519)-N(6))-dimethyltransferase RsmA [Pseudomonadota bacterium]
MTRSTHRARKRFGQHFLNDAGVIRRILEAIAPGDQDHVVEIGPGLGALTEALAKRAGALTLLEIDRDLIQRLAARYGEIDHVNIVPGDVLETDWLALSQYREQPFKLIGNLPYNISTPLLFKLADATQAFSEAVFMLQKEVVDRMVAAPGSKTYGRLSVMLQCRFDADALFDVPPECFDPPPKVTSSVVRLEPLVSVDPRTVGPVFANLVTQAFSQRRKTIRNSLKHFLDAGAIQAQDIDPAARPETLSGSDFAALAAAAGAAG